MNKNYDKPKKKRGTKMLCPKGKWDLKEYLFFKRMTVQEFSDLIDYSRTHVSAVINGHLKPTKRLAKSIERVTNGEVKAQEWLKEEPCQNDHIVPEI